MKFIPSVRLSKIAPHDSLPSCPIITFYTVLPNDFAIEHPIFLIVESSSGKSPYLPLMPSVPNKIMFFLSSNL